MDNGIQEMLSMSEIEKVRTSSQVHEMLAHIQPTSATIFNRRQQSARRSLSSHLGNPTTTLGVEFRDQLFWFRDCRGD